MFDFFKSTELLRDESKHAKFMCNDKDCNKDCNDCPTYHKTNGDMALCRDDYKSAIKNYNKAIRMAPDFAEAWNNIGNAYGMSGDYERAINAFDKAISFDPKYGRALFGKVVTLKNLKRYKEAIDLCDGILKLYNNQNVKDIKKEILEKIESERKNRYSSDIKVDRNYMNEIVKIAYNSGYIKSMDLPYVPELIAMSDDFITEMLKRISKDYGGFDLFKVSLGFSCYGGIGAAAHWNNEWGNLKEKGLFRILTEERGFNEMDEYITDYIGMGFSTNESDRLIELIGQCCMINIKQSIMNKTYDNKEKIRILKKSCKDMYMLGVAIQLNRIGMY